MRAEFIGKTSMGFITGQIYTIETACKESWELTGAKMVVVDGENIKEDTYYRCIEGEIVEVTEDGEIVEE